MPDSTEAEFDQDQFDRDYEAATQGAGTGTGTGSSGGLNANNIFNRLADAGTAYLNARNNRTNNPPPLNRTAPVAPAAKTNWLPWVIGGVALFVLAGIGFIFLGGRRGTA